MEPERLWLPGLGHECRARWERVGHEGSPTAALVSIGTLTTDGRWYVQVFHQGSEARPYPNEIGALRVAQAWMDHIGGRWRRIPCVGFTWQPGEQP